MRAHIEKMVIVSGLLLVSLSAHGADCDCRDILDLEIRASKAEVAIDEYREVLTEWKQARSRPKAGDAYVDENGYAVEEQFVPPATETFRAPIQARVSAAMSRFNSPRETYAGASTEGDCTVTNLSKSKCMVSAIDAHEQVHISACKSEGTWRFNDLESCVREEISGYQAERSYIQAQLTRLKRDCARDLVINVRQHFYNGCLEWRRSGEIKVPLGDFTDTRPFGSTSFNVVALI